MKTRHAATSAKSFLPARIQKMQQRQPRNQVHAAVQLRQRRRALTQRMARLNEVAASSSNREQNALYTRQDEGRWPTSRIFRQSSPMSNAP